MIAELAGTGAAPTALASHGIRIPPIDGAGRHPNVQAEPAFQKGWFEVQDEGSQIVAELAGATPACRCSTSAPAPAARRWRCRR